MNASVAPASRINDAVLTAVVDARVVRGCVGERDRHERADQLQLARRELAGERAGSVGMKPQSPSSVPA